MTETVATLADLVRIVDVRDVIFHELSGKRSEDVEEDQQEPLATRVLVRNTEGILGVRFQTNLNSFGGSYVADAEVVYAISEQVEIEPPALQEFLERVAMMTVYPYLRAAIADTATRLSLKRPVLGLLRAEEVHLYREDEEEATPVESRGGLTD